MVCKKLELDWNEIADLLIDDNDGDGKDKRDLLGNLNNQNKKNLVEYLLYGVK